MAAEATITMTVEDMLLLEIKKLQQYVVCLAGYAEDRHPLGVSEDDCDDQCLTAAAIRYAHTLRGDA